MTRIFERAFEHTIGIEGGFVDDPSDSGGATKFGITERVARANGYAGKMEELELELAQWIAKRQYWNVLALDEIAGESPDVALELFDTAYNMGAGKAGRFLQTALNALNNRGKHFPDLEVDGLIGPMTVTAFRAFMRIRQDRGRVVLLRALNCLQGAGYIELSQASPKDERFVFGWLWNRVEIESDHI